jgi:Outer membrane protein beta-barrel domain
MMMLRFVAVTAFVLATVVPAASQSFEVGAHVAAANWSEFDDVDMGVGGRFTWKPMPLIGLDADVTWYPGDQLGQFSRYRFEGLFGVTVGPKIDRVRPFVKAAAGFLEVAGTTGAFACIAIFPPPLPCALAGGDTLSAYEIGGGAEVDITPATFFRADVTSRILNYPGPTFDRDGGVRLDGFAGQALRFTFGGGLRF